jgi:hypothetical protein
MADQDQTNTTRNSEYWNELNEMTLAVMANRSKYDKCKKTLANTSDTIQDTFRKEKMYYKDRILNMTSDLFHERCENDTINEAHQEYVKACIEYLKWNDITDMVGDDTRNEVRNDESDINEARIDLQQKIMLSTEVLNGGDGPDDDEQKSSSPPSPPPSPPPPPSQTHSIMSIANKMCIRKKTIDDFIVLKPRTDNEQDINARLPKVRDYQTEITKRVAAASTERLD